MPNQRLNLLRDWLAAFFADKNFSIRLASDDASFRRYFRVEHNNSSFIAMDAPPAKENCKSFVYIANQLRQGGIHTPKIIQSNLAQGFLLLEDLGTQTFLDAQQQSFTIKHYQNAIDTLINMQTLTTKSIDIAAYDDSLLRAEMQLLIDWYLPPLNTQQQAQLQGVFKLLSNNALSTNQVFVHRDYHSRNLMLLNNNELGVIDFQDAVIGSNTYDLASLLKDAYYELRATDLQTLLQYYYQQANITVDFADFEKQFNLIGLQRHLKILGIFKRLSIRDAKHQYLANIPLVAKYALAIATQYSELSPLKEILKLAINQTQAMILAAGRGQRMMPLTKNTPKPLIKVKGVALIEHSINALKQANISNIIINTSYLSEQLKAHLGDGANFDTHITYSDESSGALETAGGIIKALPLLGEQPFIVINSDVLCDYELSKLSLPDNALAHLILIDNPKHHPNGDFSLDKQGMCQISENNILTFAGIGIYHPKLFKAYINSKQKLPLYPVFTAAIANNQLSGEYYSGYWQDVGTPQRLQFVNNC